MANGATSQQSLVSSPTPLASTSAARSSLNPDGGTATAGTPSSFRVSPVVRFSSRSPNVYLTLCFNFLDGAFFSMWAMQLLPVFLFKATSSITLVSMAATVSGVAQLLGALIAGYVAGRQPRQHSIRGGAVFAMVALAVFATAFWTMRVRLILCAQALWGLYTGIISTSVEALFADSVPQGHRTTIYNVKWIVQTLCYIVGYGLASLLFIFWGNEWDTQRVRVAMTLGVFLHPIALVPLCFLQDRYAVGEEHCTLRGDSRCNSVTAEEVAPAAKPTLTVVTTTEHDAAVEPPTHLSQRLTTPQPAHTSPSASTKMSRLWFTAAASQSASADTLTREAFDGQAKHIETTTHMTSRRMSREEAHDVPTNDGSSFLQQPHNEVLGQKSHWLRWMHRADHSSQNCCWRDLVTLPFVPYWLYSADLLLAIGSGMSLPYFPLFFAVECNISPAGLNTIYILSTLLTATISACLTWFIQAGRLGRVPTALFVRLLGTAALAIFAIAKSTPDIVVLFLCRNSLMNSVFGITRSVIMDCVPKESRAKWSALESVSFASWAGSAVLGGYVTNHHGYRLNFAVTAAVQLTAVLLMIPATFGERALAATYQDAPPPQENNNAATPSATQPDMVKETHNKH